MGVCCSLGTTSIRDVRLGSRRARRTAMSLSSASQPPKMRREVPETNFLFPREPHNVKSLRKQSPPCIHALESIETLTEYVPSAQCAPASPGSGAPPARAAKGEGSPCCHGGGGMCVCVVCGARASEKVR